MLSVMDPVYLNPTHCPEYYWCLSPEWVSADVSRVVLCDTCTGTGLTAFKIFRLPELEEHAQLSFPADHLMPLLGEPGARHMGAILQACGRTLECIQYC